MSGAALWCGHLLVGLIVGDQEAFEATRLVAEPVSRLFREPGFRELIGADFAVEAVELADRRPRVAVPAPAYLLRAEAETARFRSRAGELARLTAWCQGQGVRVRLLTGPGGQGKTRLARELAARLAATGQWAAEMIPEGVRLPSGLRWPLLAVVDYAETRPDQVRDLILSALTGQGETPVRLLILARSAGDWWDRLRTGSAELEMALAGAFVDELGALDDAAAGRERAFAEALSDYGQALARMDWPCADTASINAPALGEERFGSALQLQMIALAALLAGGESASPAEEVILRHETRYWRHTADKHGLHVTDQTLRHLVAAAALCGAASGDQAMALLSRLRGFRDQSEDMRLRAARWLRDLYPPPVDLAMHTKRRGGRVPYWGPLQPDLLAEHLVATVADASPGFLTGLLEYASGEQHHQALTVLSRAAASRPALAELLAQLFGQLPGLAPVAVSVATQSEDPAPVLAALTTLGEHANVPLDLLEATANAIPDQTQSQAPFAAAIWEKLVLARTALAEMDPGAYLPDLAGSLNNLSNRLAGVGQSAEALAAARRAVDIYGQLAETSPDTYLPDLAMALNTLSNQLGEEGMRGQALAAVQRAVEIYERLAEASPETYLPDLAASLNNLSDHVAGPGESTVALAAIQRAVDIYQRAADLNPDTFMPYLFTSLNNLSNRLDNAGRHAEALTAAQRAAAIARQLAEASPDAHLPGLAMALTTLSHRLSTVGRRAEALTSIQHAVDIREQLAETSPDAHLPDLANSLNALSNRLADAGRQEEALVVAQRAVEVSERLAEANPEPHLPGLAGSLNTVSNRLREAGQETEALAAIRRAVEVYARIADKDPDAHLPDLAGSLNNLSIQLADGGHRTEALTSIQRAACIWEQLAETSPEAHLPGLAMSLSTLSSQLDDAGHKAEALAAARHAVEVCERLAAASPDVYTHKLAQLLYNLSGRLAGSGQKAEALAAITRAVQMYDQLSDQEPGNHLPELAATLNNLSNRLTDVGRPEEALAVIQRAVAIREQLAQTSPDTYLPALATSLTNLSNLLAQAGRQEEALAAIQRVVRTSGSRRPADSGEHLADPDTSTKPPSEARLPDYALSLYNLSNRLAGTGRLAEAVTTIQQAVDIYERLAKADPKTFGEQLARSLANLGRWLQESGKPVHSVEPILKARAILEKNHRTDLAKFIGFMLRDAYSSEPRAVKAEFERLTGQQWPRDLA